MKYFTEKKTVFVSSEHNMGKAKNELRSNK